MVSEEIIRNYLPIVLLVLAHKMFFEVSIAG